MSRVRRIGERVYAADDVEPLLAQLRALLDDLRRSYPDPAPYTTEAIVIQRLTAILEVR